jgi:LPS export ABC transporter protein LptC
MNKLRLLAGLFVLLLGLAAVWLAGNADRGKTATTADADSGPSAYDYEARDVIVRQMGPDGKLQYQIEAEQITQLPKSGRIAATALVMHHEPPGAAPGGENRWTMTAESAELPAQGSVVTLQGRVRANGRPLKSNALVTLATEQLEYDLDSQKLSSDGDVSMTWGNNSGQGRRLRANIKTGVVALESQVHVTLNP